MNEIWTFRPQCTRTTLHYYAMAVSRELSGDMRGCESTCVCHAILHSA